MSSLILPILDIFFYFSFKMMANVEAFIDFSEDENIEEDIINHGIVCQL